MPNKQNQLFVFVKGNKGIGGFEITDTNFEPKHSDVVESQTDEPAISMDRRAIESSLEYIKANRGKNSIPSNPVIYIFTTFENNYHVVIGDKESKSEKSKIFMEKLNKLKNDFKRPGIGNNDEVKCYWIPKNFHNCMEDVNQLLKKKKH